jgi:hypothetical protein
MMRAEQPSDRKQSEEKTDSSQLPIDPLINVDRLGDVKIWLKTKPRRPKATRAQRFRFLHKVAAIIAKTYAECGDAAVLPDDVALMCIRDLLLELDEEIIKRNKNKVRIN